MLAEAYKILLDLLTIKDHHKEGLLKRGFSSENIEENGYKTWPFKRSQLVEKFTQIISNPEGIPGFFKEKDGRWQLTGSSGTVIPVRAYNGEISSFKIRTDGEKAFGKYITLSSNPKGKTKYPNGTAANISVHYPLRNKEFATEKLIITEGELKADLVNIFLKDSYCISLPGVAMWDWGKDAVEKLKPRNIYLAFDADKNKECSTSKPTNTPFIVAKSLAKLYTSLKESGFNVFIYDWGEEYGKGIDDVLTKGFEDKIKTFSDDEAKQFCQEALKHDMPLDWIYIIGIERFHHLPTGTQLKDKQFDAKFFPFFEGQKGLPTRICLKKPNFPRVDSQVYHPNGLKIFTKGDEKFLNIWEPCNLEPIQGDITPFLEHITYLLPNPEERNILFDWIAYNVRYPEEKMMWSIFMQGKHGIGKSYIGHVLGLLLGEYNVSIPTNENLKSRFNTWFQHCCVVVINELMVDRKISVMNKLKSYITDSPISIEGKGVNVYNQPNIANFMFFSNYKNAIFIEPTERRYCVFFSPAEPKQGPRKDKYFVDLFDWTNKNAGKLLHFFMQRDLSNFYPKGDAPMTDSRLELIKESYNPLELWVREGLELCNQPFKADIVSIQQLVDHLPKYVVNVNAARIGRVLKAAGCVQLGQFRVNNERMRLWSIRDHLRWTNANKEAVVKEYLSGFSYYSNSQNAASSAIF